MRTQINYLKGADSLYKILELSFDAEASYEELKSTTLNRDLIDWLTTKQELTTDFIMQILTLLQHYEIPPRSHYTMKGKIGKIWLDVKLKFLKFNNDLIVRECNKIDNLMLEVISKQIKLGLTNKEISQIYTNYKKKLRLLLNLQQSQELLII